MSMFSDSYAEFCHKAEKAAEVNKGLKFPRYCNNLRFSGDGIYSYGAKIANIDLKEKQSNAWATGAPPLVSTTTTPARCFRSVMASFAMSSLSFTCNT